MEVQMEKFDDAAALDHDHFRLQNESSSSSGLFLNQTGSCDPAAIYSLLDVSLQVLIFGAASALLCTTTLLLKPPKSAKFKLLTSTLKLLGQILTLLRIFIEDVLLFWLTFAWMTPLALPCGAFTVWRGIVHVYLKFKFGRLGEVIAPWDSISTVDTPNSKQMLICLKVMGGNCDMAHLRSSCEKTVSRRNAGGHFVYPKFFQYLSRAGGFFCWKPAVNFDIKYHVRLLQEGTDSESAPSMSESTVLEKMSAVVNTDFRAETPNWEVLVVPKFHFDKDGGHHAAAKNGGNFEAKNGGKPANPELSPTMAVIIRVHHAMGDGYAIMKLIMKDIAEERGEIIPEKFQRRSKSYSFLTGLATFLYCTLKSARALYRENLLRDSNPLYHGKLSGEKVIIWSSPILMERLKQIKNKLGVGMSSVLISAVNVSVQKYIFKHYNVQPKALSAVIPVPAPNHPDDKMCNKFSVVVMPLPLPASPPGADGFARCRLVQDEASLLARSPDAPFNLFLIGVIGLMPICFYRWFLTNKQSTILISNIPGPNRPINFWKQPLLDAMFWLPSLGTAGISVACMSYESQLRIGLTVDTGVITGGRQGAREILNGILDDLTDMEKLVEREGKD